MILAAPSPTLPELRYCAECGHPFYPTRVDQIFHSRPCKIAKHQRRINGGLKLYDAAMPWRIERPRGALVELTAVADQLAAEERIINKKRCEVIKAAKEAAIKARKP